MNEFLTWALPIFIALALFALSYNALQVASRSGDYWMANVWFGLGALVLALRFIYWGITTSRSLTLRLIVCFLVVGSLVVITVEAFRSINHKRRRWIEDSIVKTQQLEEEKQWHETPKYDLTPGAVQPITALEPKTEGTKERLTTPEPNLVFRKLRITKLLADERRNRINEDSRGWPAAVVGIENDADVPYEISSAHIRAAINFTEIGGEHTWSNPDSTWLEDLNSPTHFRQGEVKTLMIACELDNKICTAEVKVAGRRGLHTFNERIFHELTSTEYHVKVQLFANHPRKMVGKREYKLITRPELKIEEINSLEKEPPNVSSSESSSKLDILYDSGYPYEYHNHSSGISEIRIGIKNTSDKEIPRVRVQIDEIRLAGHVYKSLPLCIARKPHYLEFPLAPEETEFVGIAFSIGHNRHAELDHRSGDNINSWLKAGTYNFTISAIGTNTKSCRKQAVLDADAEGHLIFRLVSD
jgi:hypothetical protein